MGYHNIKYRINKTHPLYQWCDDFAHAQNNMQNAVLYRIRNLYTGLNKQEKDRHPNEQQIIDEFYNTHAKLDNPKWEPPTKEKLTPSYETIDTVMRYTKNPDYYSDQFSVKTAQKAIKQTKQDMDSFFASTKDWKQHTEKYSGKPRLPKYKHKNGVSTFIIDNQDGKIETTTNGTKQLKLPKTKTRLKLGDFIPDTWVFKEAKVKPDGNTYVINVIFDDGLVYPELSEKIERIAAGDLGVDNLIACVNNVGGKSLIIKGGVVKSVNQYRNKKIAGLQSSQTKGGEEKFVMTDEAWSIEHYRSDKIADYFSKAAIVVRDWCVENRIDTFVLGYNQGWKTDVVMRHESKQSFVQIPLAQFSDTLEHVLRSAGIRFVRQEESYTSKASLLDFDLLPVYGSEDDESRFCFSGYRVKRGLYKSKITGLVVNADLNAAGNILRKAFPWAFDNGCGVLPVLCERSQVIVVKHPDLGAYHLCDKKSVSLSSARRRARQLGFVNDSGCAVVSQLSGVSIVKRSPSGIELAVIAKSLIENEAPPDKVRSIVQTR